MSSNEDEETTVNFFDPVQLGSLALFGRPIPRIYFSNGVIGRVVGFLLVWGSIGIGMASIGYVGGQYVVPAVSESAYTNLVRISAPYYTVFAQFANSEFFYPASISGLVAVYLLVENKPSRFNYSVHTPDYKVREEPFRMLMYTVLIGGSLYAYFELGVVTAAVVTNTVVVGWVVVTRLRWVSKSDRYSLEKDTAFYPRKFPVAAITAVYVFGALTILTGEYTIGMYSVGVSMGLFYGLLGFRAGYKRVFDTNPELFYAYTETVVGRNGYDIDVEEWESDVHHALFVQKLFEIASGIQSNEKNQRDTYNPVGESDKAMNRGVTPVGSDSGSTTSGKVVTTGYETEDNRSETGDTDESVDVNDTVERDEKLINNLSQGRGEERDREFVPEPTCDVSDFDEPVLHYTTEIDTELVYDINTNPLIRALELLEEIEEIEEISVNDEFAEVIEKLQWETRRGWWTIDEVIRIRDSISPATPDTNGEVVTYEKYELLYEYSKQLTKVERYLKRVDERKVSE